MSSSGPAISVVVATYNGGARLARLLDALARQEVPGGAEAIIVDDASTDDSWSRLEQLAAASSMPVHPLRQPANRGPAAARNVGWQAARAPLVAFTDDDCVPQPGWLAALVDGLASADLVQGATVPAPDQLGRLGPFSQTIHVTAENGHYETCNMAYRRSVLEAVDGFDETFRLPFGEDMDLALRAKGAGFTATFRADATVQHDVEESSWRGYARRRGRRRDFPLLARRHAAARAELSMGVFSHPNAVAVALATVAVAARPRWGVLWLLAAALLGRYAAKTIRTAPPPRHKLGWLAVVPQHLAADLYEVSVMARASVRHGRLVL